MIRTIIGLVVIGLGFVASQSFNTAVDGRGWVFFAIGALIGCLIFVYKPKNKD